MNTNIYKFIPGTNDKYMIGTDGKIIKLGVSKYGLKRDMDKAEYANITYNEKGYQVITMNLNGKKETLSVNRLMLYTFQPRSDWKELHAHHKDGNPSNNHLHNLEWLSRKEHAKFHAKRKNKEHKIIYDITADLYYIGVKEAAKALNTSTQAIYNVLNNYRKKVKGHIIRSVEMHSLPEKIIQ